MRFHNLLEEVLGSKPRIKILRVMLKTKAPLTGRKIAVLSGLNHRTCLLSLNDLTYEGFIFARAAGRSKIYTLNPENVFLQNSISRIINDESRLFYSLFQSIKRKLKGKVTALLLFGSVAEGKEDPGSDIDICVVIRSSSNKKVIQKIIEYERKIILIQYGNDLSPYYITKGDFIEKYKRKNKLICEIADKGKLLIGARFY